MPVWLYKGKPQTQQQRSQQKMAFLQEYQHGHLRSTENHQRGESEFSKGKFPEKGTGNFLMSHPHAYTLRARLSTTTFAAVGNGESYWTTCMKTRKKERKKNNSGRAVGQKQARKMSTRQNDATSIKMMLLSMIALGRWWCWWWATTPSQCILTVREKFRAQISLQILGCCPNFFDPSFPPLENWNNSTHLVRMLEWINEDLPRTPAPRRHKISGSY